MLTTDNSLCRALHNHPSLMQVRKAEGDTAGKDIDVRRERPYEHLTLGQKGVSTRREINNVLLFAVHVHIIIYNSVSLY